MSVEPAAIAALIEETLRANDLEFSDHEGGGGGYPASWWHCPGNVG